MTRVLILVASRHGSTREIGERILAAMRAGSVDAVLHGAGSLISLG